LTRRPSAEGEAAHRRLFAVPLVLGLLALALVGTGVGAHGERESRVRLGGSARYVYGVRGGRIRFVAVATRAASKNLSVLRRYLALAKLG
jgi:hypothetical protein